MKNNKLCDTCSKEDVCKYKEQVTQAEKDIITVAELKNKLLNITVDCKKWAGQMHNFRNTRGGSDVC